VSGAQRRKGREGELAARDLFRAHGFEVSPLQAGRTGRPDGGDFLAEGINNVLLICDAKRREKVRVVEWSRALEAVARRSEVAVVVWRQSREPWRVTLLAEDFARLLTR
jgi:hypothetical protein